MAARQVRLPHPSTTDPAVTPAQLCMQHTWLVVCDLGQLGAQLRLERGALKACACEGTRVHPRPHQLRCGGQQLL